MTAGPTGSRTPPGSAPRQLSTDDSFAAEQMREGMPRKDAETGPQAHAITRWLGIDSPEDLLPHTDHVELTEDGWLLVCSDGLWNYCSDATELRELVGSTVGVAGSVRVGPGHARPGAHRLRQRQGRRGQHHRRAGQGGGHVRAASRRRRARRRHIADRHHDASQHRRGQRRWHSSPLRSSRTSSCQTAAPTSTRSCGSPARAPARSAPAPAPRRPRSSSSTRRDPWAPTGLPKDGMPRPRPSTRSSTARGSPSSRATTWGRWSTPGTAWPRWSAWTRAPARRPSAPCRASGPTGAPRWAPG